MVLDDYRDKDGELSRKHGSTLIGTLRSHYGVRFVGKFVQRHPIQLVQDIGQSIAFGATCGNYEAAKLAQI